ncbi:hypothetical protein Aspvir_005215 [Aspergillus viridinutans]|uniref:Uncharacterized protein n=1 Tax=Aspergillus viridinutans TaxID=75553 RepID=A0A9P3F4L9_ASPVI|nr:uncharacterized protein Aspvir_005215 [Aspergillus viridinutans]GIK01183.1 hypothetical protein Aspvir_005215 [Aspergillus viridinutans]
MGHSEKYQRSRSKQKATCRPIYKLLAPVSGCWPSESPSTFPLPPAAVIVSSRTTVQLATTTWTIFQQPLSSVAQLHDAYEPFPDARGGLVVR